MADTSSRRLSRAALIVHPPVTVNFVRRASLGWEPAARFAKLLALPLSVIVVFGGRLLSVAPVGRNPCRRFALKHAASKWHCGHGGVLAIGFRAVR